MAIMRMTGWKLAYKRMRARTRSKNVSAAWPYLSISCFSVANALT